MAYSETVAARIRESLSGTDGVSEKKMVGGVCFMVHGHMVAGVVGEELMLRLGRELTGQVLAMGHTRPMDFTGKVMKTMVYVAPKGFETDADLKEWLQLATDHARTLPPK